MGDCYSSTERIIEQAAILNDPVSKIEIQKLYTYESAICKIKSDDKTVSNTGFFCEINDDDIPFKKALFTSSHTLDDKKIKINEEIEIEYLNEIKKIIITKNRRKFTNKKLDYTCIEILDTDNIKNFFDIEEYFQKDDNIYVLQYLSSGELSDSAGKITNVDNDLIKYSTSSLVVSSGSPLIKRCNKIVIIGIHLGEEKVKNPENEYKYLARPLR